MKIHLFARMLSHILACTRHAQFAHVQDSMCARALVEHDASTACMGRPQQLQNDNRASRFRRLQTFSRPAGQTLRGL